MKPYYEHAGITIYHGDCREVLPLLPSFDLLLTDPPYGLKASRAAAFGQGDTRDTNGLGGYNPGRRYYGDLSWDDERADDSLIEFFRSKAKTQIIWGGNYFTLPPARCWLFWDKLRGDTDFADGELAWTNLDRAVRRIAYRWNGFLVDQNSRDYREHPTQKPLAVIKWAMSFAKDAKTVLDPMLGSGTTLEAAKVLGLYGTGVEIEERYCEIAAKRLSQEVLDFGNGDTLAANEKADSPLGQSDRLRTLP